jgi:3'-5' exoribonuclease Rv2179c-like domain
VKFFLDTEFIERGPQYPIQLISIGIVCENGKEFYAQSSDYDPATASEWIKANVFPHLEPIGKNVPAKAIAEQIESFVEMNSLKNSDGSKSKYDSGPEFWGYYADYDWVVFCQLFGAMIDLPKGWPMYCRDLKQWCDMVGNPKLPKQASDEHNALKDAQWNMQIYHFLNRFTLERAKIL